MVVLGCVVICARDNAGFAVINSSQGNFADIYFYLLCVNETDGGNSSPQYKN